MAALTGERDTVEIGRDARCIAVPVKTGVTIYQGAFVALDAEGYAVPARKAQGLTAVGRARKTVAGAEGSMVEAERGVFVWDNDAENPVTRAHLLQPCYLLDDQTVTASPTGASVAGLVVRADANGVAVQVTHAPHSET